MKPSEVPLPGSGTVPARPAATVVLLRDGAAGSEVLLVQRNARLAFHGGAWVFPGGRIDEADYAVNTTDTVAAARCAACREAWEEAGITIAPAELVRFARWVTPEGLPKRFDTWFFAARAASDTVRIDGGEIHAHQWITPAAAIEAHRSGTLELPPPTWVTLHQLTLYPTVADSLAALGDGGVEDYVPRVRLVSTGACSLYAGDVAYDGGDIDAPGPRHRLWMLESGWHYERRPSGDSVP